MTDVQEDMFYEFLMTHTEPFSLKEVVALIRSKENFRAGKLASEITSLITTHRLAFETGVNKWITRAGCFTGAKLVIRPTKDELLNGILILGHRFAPFANPILMQKEYQCRWKGKPILFSDTEASPEELYPYYSIYGEEFAPQFLARENPQNEEAFNADPYEDPAEVSIKTLDMRTIYRESGFVPGDRIVARLVDWRNSIFELERVVANDWNNQDLQKWICAAEEGFKRSFEKIGPNCTTEEQISWAYFFGGPRMRDVPAYSLEDFLYEKTDKIECAPFGIESRFWFAGKEIPDFKKLVGVQTQSDQTPIEKILFDNNVPISEYVVQAYIRDALFRKDTEVGVVIERIVPPSIPMRRWNLELLAAYIIDTFQEFREGYSIFTDKKTGPLRQRAAELHTAVIDLSARLGKGEIDPTWLPKHSFIILSQIQNHAAGLLEDFVADEEIPENELIAIENSLDSMLDTYEDTKEMIEKSLDNYRRSNITLVKFDSTPDSVWRMIQIGIGGTDVWRRLVIPQTMRLVDLHKLIQALFGWTEMYPHRFIFEYKSNSEFLDTENNIKTSLLLSDLAGHGFSELIYEYGTRWTVKIILLAVHNAEKNERARCVAGENAAPPEKIEGPLRFRRFISALDSHNEEERAMAKSHLGANFKSTSFDINKCNMQIEHIASRLS